MPAFANNVTVLLLFAALVPAGWYIGSQTVQIVYLMCL
jgi:hypothetical protein